MGDAHQPRVAFGALGPVDVLVDGRVVTLGSPKVRQLLAALLVHANSVVSSDRLVEILWGETPPADALRALQKNVHRLRSLIRATRGSDGDDMDVLVTRAPGYVLVVEPECYDARRFESLVVRAQQDGARGDPDAALDGLDDALALWRGPAFAEFASDEFARTEATRLDELRVVAIEERVEAKLALGRHDAVTGELDALVAEFPYRERLWGQLMVALYRSGRQADALRAYSRVRTLLAEELGIDPGAALRSLEEAILLQKAELDLLRPPSMIAAAATLEDRTGTNRGVWRPTLPIALAQDDQILGRDAEMAWLDNLLAHAPRGPVGALLRGERGSGRTALVVQFGRRAFEDGCAVLYGSALSSRRSRLQPLLDAVAVIGPTDDLDGSDPQQFALALRDVILEVARSTSKPVVLIVDDIDRADPQTVDVLERLIAEPAELLIVATTAASPGGDDTDHPWWTAERALSPLRDQDVAMLLDALLGKAASPELATSLLEETGGNARRVNDMAARLAEAELDQRVERAVARAEVAQRDLRARQGELATSVGDRVLRSAPARYDNEPTDLAAACPYKGLAHFEAADEAFFCGRDRTVNELVAHLATSRFVAVIGPSGSGKSSLVHAGLMPALRRGALPGSRGWKTLLVTPGDAFEVDADRQVTLMVDQLEELFTAGHDEPARAAFLDSIVRAATTPDGMARVVVAFRGDYLDRFAAFPAFARLVGESQLLVGPMNDAEIHAAIEEPAHRVALTLEAGLADTITSDVAGQPGALPLLSTALLETWVRRRGRMLTHAGYHEAGGVTGAVARLAEDTYRQFTPGEQRACRRMLLRLAEPGDGPDDVRRRISLAELADPGETRVLRTLVARRLVTTSDGTAEVAHEALLREWPRLRTWLEEDRDSRRLHHRVATAATEWDAAGRDPTELYRGTRLDAALDWSATHPDAANPLERDFLAAGATAHDHELRSARRTARRLRSLTVGLAGLLIVALVAGTIALVQRGDADRQATRASDAATLARATQLATLARTLPSNRNDLAMLLGVEGRRLQPSITTDGGLEAALTHRSPNLERVVHFDTPVSFPTLSSDGRLLLAPGNDGNVRIYTFATGRLLRTLRGTGDPAFVAQFNDDASLVVSGSVHGKVTVWRVATGKPIGPPIVVGGSAVYAAFSGAMQLVTFSDNQTVAAWDFSDPQHPRQIGDRLTFPLGTGDVPVVAGGGVTHNLLAVGGSSSRHTTIFDVPTHRVVQQFDGTPGAFSPDGRVLATTLDDRVVLWDVATGAERGELHMDSHPVAAAPPVFSPDGSRLAAADLDDNAIRVFDVATGTLVVDPLLIHSNFAAPGVFLSRDRLVTFGANEAALWNLGRPVHALERDLGGHPGGKPNTENGAFGQFTPDGKEILTVGVTDKQVFAYDAATGSRLTDFLGGRIATEWDLAFSPDSKVVASGGLDGSLTLWDRATGRELSHLDTGQIGSTALAWQPHRPLLVASVGSGSTYFWDVSDPRHPVAQPRRTLTTPGGIPSFSPDGRLLVVIDSFGTKTGSVFDVASGHKLLSFGRDYSLTAVSFTPDSRTFAAVIGAVSGGQVALYDTTTWRRRNLILSYGPTGIAFVDDGARFVTLSFLAGGRVDLWDTATLQPVGEPITLTTEDNNTAAANPRGTQVVFGSFNGATPVLDVDPNSWQRTACRLAGRNFTHAEWAQYFPGQTYRGTCTQWPAGQ